MGFAAWAGWASIWESLSRSVTLLCALDNGKQVVFFHDAHGDLRALLSGSTPDLYLAKQEAVTDLDVVIASP